MSTRVPGRRQCQLLFSLALIQACAATPERPAPCSDQWNVNVDSVVETGDGAGHGPDLGSEEWKSVVEFKLGIRDDPQVPDASSSAWCDYIDELLRKSGE